MIFNLLERPGGGCMTIARLVKSFHERPAHQRALGRTAIAFCGRSSTPGS